jgi:hypothetical protein
MRTIMVDCPACGGDRGFEVITGIDRRWGGFTGYTEPCRHCDATGAVEVELEPITLDDLEELYLEELAAERKT